MTIYQNQQWAVNGDGLATVPPRYEYFIDGNRLLETREHQQKTLYFWPLQLAEKTWIDIDAFEIAFLWALLANRGKYKGDVDVERLKESFVVARQMAERIGRGSSQ